MLIEHAPHAPSPVPPPDERPWVDGVMGSMLGVALLLHFVAVMAYVVLGASPGQATFFSEPGHLEMTGVELVSVTGIGPRPQGARPSSPHAAPPGPQVKARVPRTAATRPAPHAASTPARRVRVAPQAVPTRPVSLPAQAVSSRPAEGAPYRTGRSVTSPAVSGPTGRLSGQGSTGPGSSRVRPGGQGLGQAGSGNGGGGQPGSPNGSGSQAGLSATAEYQSTGFLDLQKQDMRLPEGVEPRSWEELCAFLRLSTSVLYSRPHVSPFMTRFRFVAYNHADMQAMVGRFGRVTVRITVSTDGRPTAAITGSSRDPIMDRTAFAIASSTRWLPALEQGRPVEETVDFPITFDDSTKSGIYVKAPAAPQPAQSASGPPPVTVPGGAGQMPNGIPGGAGKAPGSF